LTVLEKNASRKGKRPIGICTKKGQAVGKTGKEKRQVGYRSRNESFSTKTNFAERK